MPPHIAVVGAGIVGASIAFHLALRGARVTLIDAAAPGSGASAVSFAWLNARDKTPRHYHNLNRRSLDMWDRFARRLDADLGLSWGGELRWAVTVEGGDQIAHRVHELQSWGYPIQLLDGDALAVLEPGLTPGAVTAASCSPADGHVDAPAVVRACVAGATARGAEIRPDTRITDLHRAGDRIEALQTDAGPIPCDAAVLAGGPDTAALAAHASIDLPLYHTFGATLFTEPLPPVFRTVSVVHSPRDLPDGVNFRQFADGSVQIHGGSHSTIRDGGSLGKTNAEVDQVLATATRFLPALKDAAIREIRRGRRPMPRDGLPILGFTPSAPNLYLATMHSGVTLAALVGECAASEILDGADIDFLAPYRLARFSDPPA